MCVRPLLLLVLFLAPLASSAGMFKWVDANGQMHYSDSPPDDVAEPTTDDVHVSSISGPATITTAPTARNAKASKEKDGKVRIYTAAWCGYCKRAKAHLNSKHVPYEEVDVETTTQGRAAFSDLNGKGVPVIIVGPHRMDGFDPVSLDAMLADTGVGTQ